MHTQKNPIAHVHLKLSAFARFAVEQTRWCIAHEWISADQLKYFISSKIEEFQDNDNFWHFSGVAKSGYASKHFCVAVLCQFRQDFQLHLRRRVLPARNRQTDRQPNHNKINWNSIDFYFFVGGMKSSLCSQFLPLLWVMWAWNQFL